MTGIHSRKSDTPQLGALLRLMLPFAFAYFLSHVYRTVNAVIAPDLMESIGLSAAELGLLSSTFMLTFALAQIPLGVLLDLYGARRVEATLLCIAALGGGVFAASDNVITLAIARALMGLGVAACLMAALKTMAINFPSSWLITVHGLLVAIGGLGAIMATTPAETMVRFLGWRLVFLLLAGATVISAVVLFMLVKDPPRPRRRTTWRREVVGLRRALSHPFFLGVGPAVGLIQGGFVAIQTLWAGPWLYNVAGLERAIVGHYLLLVAVGMVAGYLVNGFMGARFSRWGLNPIVLAIIGSALLLGALGLIIVMGRAPLLLWIIFGFFGTSTTLCFALIGREVPSQYIGRVSTAMNFLVFAMAFLFQWGMGAIMKVWVTGPEEGLEKLSYQIAFSMTLSFQILGWIWLVRTALGMRQTNELLSSSSKSR
nr:MFS transporter [Halomonas socia]